MEPVPATPDSSCRDSKTSITKPRGAGAEGLPEGFPVTPFSLDGRLALLA
jgi:hypothetical protein